MLVRSGALNIGLIDGEKIEITNLNRVFCFYENDIEKYKVCVLKNKLQAINPKAKIESINIGLVIH